MKILINIPGNLKSLSSVDVLKNFAKKYGCKTIINSKSLLPRIIISKEDMDTLVNNLKKKNLNPNYKPVQGTDKDSIEFSDTEIGRVRLVFSLDKPIYLYKAP